MIAAAALALLSPPPAQASASRPEQCIFGDLSPADRDRLGQPVLTGVPHSAGSSRRLFQATAVCRLRHGWSAKDSDRYGMLAYAETIRGVAQRRLARAGVEIANIDAWFAAQPDSVRIKEPDDEWDMVGLVQQLMARGAPVQAITENGSLIGRYLKSRVAVERIRRGLPIG